MDGWLGLIAAALPLLRWLMGVALTGPGDAASGFPGWPNIGGRVVRGVPASGSGRSPHEPDFASEAATWLGIPERLSGSGEGSCASCGVTGGGGLAAMVQGACCFGLVCDSPPS